MPLHYTRDGYTFCADAQGLTIEPGPRLFTLSGDELTQLGLQPWDDYRIPIDSAAPKEDITGRILSALNEAIRPCRGPEETWMACTGPPKLSAAFWRFRDPKKEVVKD